MSDISTGLQRLSTGIRGQKPHLLDTTAKEFIRMISRLRKDSSNASALIKRDKIEFSLVNGSDIHTQNQDIASLRAALSGSRNTKLHLCERNCPPFFNSAHLSQEKPGTLEFGLLEHISAKYKSWIHCYIGSMAEIEMRRRLLCKNRIQVTNYRSS